MNQNQRDPLIKAVNELRQVVASLVTVLDQDYPKRHEIEERFIEKSVARFRLWAVIISVVLGIIFSFFVTVGTMSYCFLGNTEGSVGPGFCNVMPGYSASQERSKAIVHEFRTLQKRSLTNEDRITELEKRAR